MEITGRVWKSEQVATACYFEGSIRETLVAGIVYKLTR